MNRVLEPICRHHKISTQCLPGSHLQSPQASRKTSIHFGCHTRENTTHPILMDCLVSPGFLDSCFGCASRASPWLGPSCPLSVLHPHSWHGTSRCHSRVVQVASLSQPPPFAFLVAWKCRIEFQSISRVRISLTISPMTTCLADRISMGGSERFGQEHSKNLSGGRMSGQQRYVCCLSPAWWPGLSHSTRD